MTAWQKAVKYAAMAFAIFLSVCIIGGILGAVGIFGGIFGSNAVGEMTTYSIEGPVTELEIHIGAAALRICEGDTLSVESNLKKLTVDEKPGGCLAIKEDAEGFFNIGSVEGVLTLYLPAGMAFDGVTITTGAGTVSIDELYTGSLAMELGAGEVKIDRLTANQEADIDGGAGALTIRDCMLNNLDMDMGVGELNLTGILTQNCQISMGVGEANLTLVGSASEYCIQVDKGLGAVTVDGRSVSSGEVIGTGDDRIDIDGGVGEINVDFTS